MYNFNIDDEQIAKFNEWATIHDKTCMFYHDESSLMPKAGAIGGRLTFEFTQHH